jgi:glycosyltransferase involved in cell wall biosynthesis
MTETLNKNTNIKQEFWDFSQDDPTRVFGKSSVLVLPAVEDGFGLVALEAMACGLPVIVTSNCGAADVVNNGINGFIAPPRDVETMANQLRFLAENESRRAEMGQFARITSQQYNQQVYQNKFGEIFSNQDLITPIFT